MWAPQNAQSTQHPGEIEYEIQQAANKPVKKKKKAIARETVEGSHLAHGSAGGKPTGTAVRTSQELEEPERISSPSPLREPKRGGQKQLRPRVASSESDEEFIREKKATRPPRQTNTKVGTTLSKQPSIVREAPEEEEEEAIGSSTGQSAQYDPNTRSFITPPSKPRPISSDTNTTRIAAAPNSSKRIGEVKSVRASSQPPRLITQLPTPTEPSSSNTLQVGSINGSVRAGRGQSLSPSRSAHFGTLLATDSAIEPRHEPLPRSVSPAKSAMKRSPSPQPRSPTLGSEISDASAYSEEGSRSAGKKKKNVRVSFDEDAIIVPAVGSPPSSPDSQTIVSPQNKEARRRGLFGFGKSKQSQPAEDLEEEEEGMRPTPALPSFGSVRRGKEEAPRIPPTVSEATSGNSSLASSMSNYSNPTTLDTSMMSSDHVVGGILSQDFSKKASAGQEVPREAPPNEPLPPEVTSVEGDGNLSDSESSAHSIAEEYQGPPPVEFRAVEDTAPPAPSTEPAVREEPAMTSDAVQSEAYDEQVPVIAIQPATPAPEEDRKRDSWFGIMPGGFPVSSEALSLEDELATTAVTEISQPSIPATAGIAEPSSAETVTHSDRIPPAISPAQPEAEESDSGDSIYSDAAEDLSDVEGDGFGSIDAVVESPVLSSPPMSAASPPDSPTVAKAPKPTKLRHQWSSDSEPEADEGWDKAQAYWSGLSQIRKAEKERAATGNGDVPEPSRAPKQLQDAPKSKAKKKAAPRQSEASESSRIGESAPFPPWPERQYQKDVRSQRPAENATLKKSMRPTSPVEDGTRTNKTSRTSGSMRTSMRGPQQSSAEEDGTHLRQSMRSSGNMKSSMRQGPQRQSMIETATPAPPPQQRGALQKKSIRPASAAPEFNYGPQTKTTITAGAPNATKVPAKKVTNPAIPLSLGRTFSNGSESDSSFRKERRSKASDSGRYTMKRSMRGGPSERPQSPSMSSVGRVASPAARGFSTSESAPSMRTSMRGTMRMGSIDSTTPTLRSGPPPKSSGGLFGRSSSKPKAAASSGPKRASRFNDSSDEEDGARGFRSRFNDSSDEDEPEALDLKPVRGIPRRRASGDSTDLDDSSADEASAAVASKNMENPTIEKPQPAHQGEALRTGSLRRVGSQNGSGIDLTTSADPLEKQKKKGFFSRFGSKRDDKISKRPTTPLVNGAAAASDSPRTPKLQRRNTPQALQTIPQDSVPPPTESWPLPQPPKIGADPEKDRPQTSDGATGGGVKMATSMRPDVGSRRHTGGSQVIDGVAFGRTGRKKRFPKLRKAFGLHD